jgi:hypothetical protein
MVFENIKAGDVIIGVGLAGSYYPRQVKSVTDCFIDTVDGERYRRDTGKRWGERKNRRNKFSQIIPNTEEIFQKAEKQEVVRMKIRQRSEQITAICDQLNRIQAGDLRYLTDEELTEFSEKLTYVKCASQRQSEKEIVTK